MEEQSEQTQEPEDDEPKWPRTPEGQQYLMAFLDKALASLQKFMGEASPAERMPLHSDREIHQEERKSRREHARPVSLTVDANRLMDMVQVVEDDLHGLKESLSEVAAQVAWMTSDLVRVRRWLKVVVAAGTEPEQTQPPAGTDKPGELMTGD